MKAETEAQLRNEAARGMRANELMSDELLVEAFTTLENRLTQEWANSPVRDSEGRERIWVMQKLLKNVEDHLREIATTGKMAALQLDQERTILQKMKEFVQEFP